MTPMLLSLVLWQAPTGFVAADEQHALTAKAGHGWMATLVDDRVRIETRVAWANREERETKRNTRIPDQKQKLDSVTVSLFKGEGTPVDDGWLTPVDAGEFGGGILWLSRDGSRKNIVSGRNTLAILKTEKGIFAVQALNHMMFWYGSLVKVERGPAGWTAKAVTDIHTSPFVVIDGDRFVMATNEYVSTLETDGTQHEIYRPMNYEDGFTVASMVRRKGGEIWIGTDRAVLRLRPKAGGEYQAQWFLPAAKG